MHVKLQAFILKMLPTFDTWQYLALNEMNITKAYMYRNISDLLLIMIRMVGNKYKCPCFCLVEDTAADIVHKGVLLFPVNL